MFQLPIICALILFTTLCSGHGSVRLSPRSELDRDANAALKKALAAIDAGVQANDDAQVFAGLDLLKQFTEIAPDSNKVKPSAVKCLKFLVQMRETEKETAREDQEQPDANADKKVVRSGVVTGRILDMPKPDYPLIAKEDRAHGPVEVRLEIGEDGRVLRILSVRGHPLLQGAAAEAALKARFSPVKILGATRKIQGSITYLFTMSP